MSNGHDPEAYYAVSVVPYGSGEYHEHLGLVRAVYQRNGFVPREATSIVDPFDDEHASYYRLSAAQLPDSFAGTFRIIESNGRTLPALAACASPVLDGIAAQFCECTRVVAARERDFYGPALPPGRYVLCEAVFRTVAYARRRHLLGFISLGSPSIFEWINATFENVQHAFGVPFWYEGGMVVPSLIWREEFERTISRRPVFAAQYEAACALHE